MHPVICPLQAHAWLEYEEYIKQMAFAGGHCGRFTFCSSLFVPPGTPWQYSGNYKPLPMLQLADMHQMQVGRQACVKACCCCQRVQAAAAPPRLMTPSAPGCPDEPPHARAGAGHHVRQHPLVWPPHL